MSEPDRLSYLVAAHVLMATPDVQLSDAPAARLVASVLGSMAKRLRRLRGAA